MVVMALAYPAVFVFVLLSVAMHAWLRVRAQRNHALSHTLALIVGQNLPLVTALRAAANGERGTLRTVYAAVAARLQAGDALSVALKSAHPSCPSETIGAIRGAEIGGTLPTVLRTIAADRRAEDPDAPSAAPALPYALLLLIVASGALIGLGIVVAPKFASIWADFGVPQSAMLSDVNRLAGWIVDHSLVIGLTGISLLTLLAQLVSRRYWIGRSVGASSWIDAALDAPMWYTPWLHRIAQARSLAVQLPVLHAAVKAGHDLHQAAMQAACVATNVYARRRLRRWAAQVATGVDPLVSARALRFPRPVLSALRAARSGADLVLALEYLSAYYRSLVSYWGRLAAALAVPIVTIVWGVFAGYLCVAVFTGLYTIVDSILAKLY